MVEIHHGILLDSAFIEGQDFVSRFNVLGTRKSQDNPWTAYLVEVESSDLSYVFGELMRNLKDGPWYAHFYNNEDGKILVVYKRRVFEMTGDRSTWEEAKNYGRSLGIPEDQLTFNPNRFEDEGKYRSV